MPKRLVHIFPIILLWANYATLFSQNNLSIDSSKKTDILITKSLTEKYFNEKRDFLFENETHFVNYLHQNNITDSAQILFALGRINCLNNNYLNATKHFLIANEYLKRNKNELLNAEIVFELANSYQRLFFLRKAIDYYKIVLKEYPGFIELERKNRIIMDIANSFYDLNQFDSAKMYYSLALDNSVKFNDHLHHTVALINIGNLSMAEKKYLEADSITRKALALSKIYKYDHLVVMCKFNLGELSLLTKDFGAAKNLFSQVLLEADKVSFQRLIPEAYKYYALMAFEERNFSDVIKYSTKFYQESGKFVVQEKKIRAIKEINTVLNKIKYVTGASENLAKNIELLDSILVREIKEKQLLMESLQQLTELQGDYKDLVNENVLKSEKLIRFKIVTGLVVVILLMGGVFVTLLVRSRNKIKIQNLTIHQQFEDIKKKNQKTEELNHEINMQSEEIRMQNDQLLTNQKELERKIKERTKDLEYALKKAEESDDLKTSFLQNLSHEIRTPLNAINGFAQLISKDKNVKTDYAEIVSQNVYDLVDIIDNIVLFSTLQANQYNFTVSISKVSRIISQLRSDFGLIKNKYKPKTIEFIIDNRVGDDQMIKTDVSLLQKALIQLVENAFKFTEKGSVSLSVDFFGDYMRFSVTDTGIGIKKEKQPYIFDTFRKIESEMVFRGTGIGLALVKKITDLLKGNISLTSEFGKGTSIFIDFKNGDI
jgi:signal transduction histidine kinase